MSTLFISDLHLDPERPAITELFGRFVDEEARGADALYILGDLFEAWVGDDDPSEAGAYVASKLRPLRDAGVPVRFIRGNRDFLLGEDYARRAGMEILPDPAVVPLYGKPVLLMHGDLLCSDDTAYQAFRAQTRDPRWQGQFLSQPLAARLAFAQQARAASKAHQSGLQSQGAMETITDAAPAMKNCVPALSDFPGIKVADTAPRVCFSSLISGFNRLRPPVPYLPRALGSFVAGSPP